MLARNSMVLMIIGLLGLSATTVGGWSMYYREKSDHESTRMLQQQRAGVGSANQDIESLLSRGSELEGDINRIRLEKDNLSKELKLAESEQIRLSGELDSMMRARDRVGTDLENMKGERARIESELGEKIRSIEAQLASVVESEEQSGPTVERLTSELEGLREARDQLSTDLEKTRGENDQIKADLDMKIQSKEMELSESVRKVATLDARFQHASKTIEGLESQIEAISRERDEIASRMNGLEQELKAEVKRRDEATSSFAGLKEELQAEMRRRSDANSRFAGLKGELETELQTRIIEIEQLKTDLTVLVVASDILFEPGSSLVSDSGHDALRRIAEVLNEFPDRPVSLEGHTDSVPIASHRRDTYASNWELSTARAAAAVRSLESQGVAPARLRAVGYGEHQPVANNADPELRSLNRRLEIRLLPRDQSILERRLN